MERPSFCQALPFQFLHGLALLAVVTTLAAVCHCVLAHVAEELLLETVLKFSHRGRHRQLLGSSHLMWQYLCEHSAERVLFLHPRVTKSSHSS